MLRCMNCGHHNAHLTTDCASCGIPLNKNNTVNTEPPAADPGSGGSNHRPKPEQTACWNCGTQHAPTASNCSQCGVPLRSPVVANQVVKSANVLNFN